MPRVYYFLEPGMPGVCYCLEPGMPGVCYCLEPGMPRVCYYVEPGMPKVCYYLEARQAQGAGEKPYCNHVTSFAPPGLNRVFGGWLPS